MKQTVICLLALGFLLPAALGKEKKIDPKLKTINTIFLAGKDDLWERDAREALGKVKCLKLAANEESADAVMTVHQTTDNVGNPSTSTPTMKGPVEGGFSNGPPDYMFRTVMDVKVREGDKLKKVWSEKVNLPGSDERKKSGAKRLVESFGEDACSDR